MTEEANFRSKVESMVYSIPKGKVMTYGQLAALAGNANSARVVGGIAHFGDPDLPWHRVVNSRGGLASGYYGGKNGHQQVLESEGYVVKNYKVNVSELLWFPDQNLK